MEYFGALSFAGNTLLVTGMFSIGVNNNYTTKRGVDDLIEFAQGLGPGYLRADCTRGDTFIVSLNPNNGQAYWGTSLGGDSKTADDYGRGVTFGEGYIYSTGSFSGTAVFGYSVARQASGNADSYVVALPFPLLQVRSPW